MNIVIAFMCAGIEIVCIHYVGIDFNMFHSLLD
jgi:hypothetical protein